MGRTTGSRTTKPSAQVKPASAPNCASRLSMSCRKSGVFRRVAAVAAPYWSDRHPDHVAASALITEALFNAGLRKDTAEGEAWKAEWICYYFINDADKPSFVVDVSDYYEKKRRALDCHVTQFVPAGAGAAATRLNTPLFRQLIESRDAQFGALAGCAWAEGVVVREPVVRPMLFREPAFASGFGAAGPPVFRKP